jgi:hypothetical protein
VFGAGGKVGGFSADGGITTKLRLLSLEGTLGNGTSPRADNDGKLGFDPAAAVAHLRAADPALKRLIDATGPLRMQLKTTPSIFVALRRSSTSSSPARRQQPSSRACARSSPARTRARRPSTSCA